MKSTLLPQEPEAAATPPTKATPKSPRSASSAWRAYHTSSKGMDDQELIEHFLPIVRNVVDRLRITLPTISTVWA